MSFYEQYSPIYTDFLNNPFVSNSNTVLNDSYANSLIGFSHFDINVNSMCENITEQSSCGSWNYSDFSDVEPSFPSPLFPSFEEMEFDLNSTNTIMKTESHEKLGNHYSLQLPMDDHLQYLPEQNGTHSNTHDIAIPSSPKSVISSSSSTRSSASESKKRVHQCNYCTRSFVRKHDLIRHKRIHTGSKPYTCPCCLKGFARSDARRHHFRKVEACRDGAEKLPRCRK